MYDRPRQILISVLLTLSYSQIFKYPLTSSEIRNRYILSSRAHPRKFANDKKVVNKKTIPSDHVPSLSEIEEALGLAHARGLIGSVGEFWCLAGCEESVGIRQKRSVIAEKRWHEVTESLVLLREIPWIEAVGVTGSLAVNNSESLDDIDFLIITREKRLWITRLLVTLIAQFKGKRRSWKHEEPNSWCFNMWLSSGSLQMPVKNRTAYGAYELCQTVWVYSQPGSSAQQRFYLENTWARQFIPNYFDAHLKRFNFAPRTTQSLLSERHLLTLLGDAINAISYWVQKRYMKYHMTNELVTPDVAFFHPRNTRKATYAQWKQMLHSITEQ